MGMDAAHNQATGTAGTGAGSPTNSMDSIAGAVRVRPHLMAELGVAARLARLASRPSPGQPFGPQVDGHLLRTERLLLRPMVGNDRAEFMRVLRLSRAHMEEFCPLGSAEARTDEQIFDRQLALSIAAAKTGWGGHACRMIALNADGRIVGGFNVNDIERGLEHT